MMPIEQGEITAVQDSLEERVGKALKERKLTLSVAESCTGGLMASCITDIPGSSQYFRGGVIAYQNDVKENILGVPHEIIAEHGVISEETVRAMATGCKRLFASDIAVAITGLAGPGGGSTETPVGVVYIAIADGTGVAARRFQWSGDRIQNKRSAVHAAITLIREVLDA